MYCRSVVTNGLRLNCVADKNAETYKFTTMDERDYIAMNKHENGNEVLADVSTRFSLTDNQIETIADLFSKRECLVVDGQETEWLLSHAFQLGMKTYRDLLNGC